MESLGLRVVERREGEEGKGEGLDKLSSDQ